MRNGIYLNFKQSENFRFWFDRTSFAASSNTRAREPSTTKWRATTSQLIKIFQTHQNKPSHSMPADEHKTTV